MSIPSNADFIISMYKNNKLVLQTWHIGEASRDVEILAVKARIAKGELDWAWVTNRFPPFGEYRIN